MNQGFIKGNGNGVSIDNLWTPWQETQFAKEFSSIDTEFWGQFLVGGATLTYDNTNARLRYNAGAGAERASFGNKAKRVSDAIVKVRVRANNANIINILRIRYDDGATGNAYQIRIPTGTDVTLKLERLEGFVVAEELDTSIQTIAVGTYYTFALKTEGTTLKGYLNGVEILSATDSNFKEGVIEIEFNGNANETADLDSMYIYKPVENNPVA
jgi:hypothetical protein